MDPSFTSPMSQPGTPSAHQRELPPRGPVPDRKDDVEAAQPPPPPPSPPSTPVRERTCTVADAVIAGISALGLTAESIAYSTSESDSAQGGIIAAIVITALVFIRLDLIARRVRQACATRNQSAVQAVQKEDVGQERSISARHRAHLSPPTAGSATELVSSAALPTLRVTEGGFHAIDVHDEPSPASSGSATTAASAGTRHRVTAISVTGSDGAAKLRRVKASPNESERKRLAQSVTWRSEMNVTPSPKKAPTMPRTGNVITNDAPLKDKIGWAVVTLQAALLSNKREVLQQALDDVRSIDFKMHISEVTAMREKWTAEEKVVLDTHGDRSKEYADIKRKNAQLLDDEMRRRKAEWAPLRDLIDMGRKRVEEMIPREQHMAERTLADLESSMEEAKFGRAAGQAEYALLAAKAWVKVATEGEQKRLAETHLKQVEQLISQVNSVMEKISATLPVHTSPALHDEELDRVKDELESALSETPYNEERVKGALADAADMYNDLQGRSDRLLAAYKDIHKFQARQKKTPESDKKKDVATKDVVTIENEARKRRQLFTKPQAAIDMQAEAHKTLDPLVKTAIKVWEGQFKRAVEELNLLREGFRKANSITDKGMALEVIAGLEDRLTTVINQLNGLHRVLPADDGNRISLVREHLSTASKLQNNLFHTGLAIAQEARNGALLKRSITSANEHFAHLQTVYNRRSEEFAKIDSLRSSLEEQYKTAGEIEQPLLKDDIEKVKQQVAAAKERMDKAKEQLDKAENVHDAIGKASTTLTNVLVKQKSDFIKEFDRLHEQILWMNSIPDLRSTRDRIEELRAEINAWLEIIPVEEEAVAILQSQFVAINLQFARQFLAKATMSGVPDEILEALDVARNELRILHRQAEEALNMQQVWAASLTELTMKSDKRLTMKSDKRYNKAAKEAADRLKRATENLARANDHVREAEDGLRVPIQNAEMTVKLQALAASRQMESAITSGSTTITSTAASTAASQIVTGADSSQLAQLRARLTNHPERLKYFGENLTAWQTRLQSDPVTFKYLNNAHAYMQDLQRDLSFAASQGAQQLQQTVADRHRRFGNLAQGLSAIPEVQVILQTQAEEMEALSRSIALIHLAKSSCELYLTQTEMETTKRITQIEAKLTAMRKAINDSPYSALLTQSYKAFLENADSVLQKLKAG